MLYVTFNNFYSHVCTEPPLPEVGGGIASRFVSECVSLKGTTRQRFVLNPRLLTPVLQTLLLSRHACCCVRVYVLPTAMIVRRRDLGLFKLSSERLAQTNFKNNINKHKMKYHRNADTKSRHNATAELGQ